MAETDTAPLSSISPAALSSALSAANGAVGAGNLAATPAPEKPFKYIPQDLVTGLSPEFASSLREQEDIVDKAKLSLPKEGAPGYEQAKQNYDEIVGVLRRQEFDAAHLVNAERKVAQALGDSTVQIGINNSMGGLESENVSYDLQKRTINVNNAIISNYGAASPEVEGMIAHEHGHKMWRAADAQGTRHQEELFSDSQIPKLGDSKVTQSYKDFLAKAHKGQNPDDYQRDDNQGVLYPSLNERRAVLDGKYDGTFPVGPKSVPTPAQTTGGRAQE